jgi:FkbM family methyltransferase
MSFVSRILRNGMTVLDIGAHHGLYTLLASKRVGRSGMVIAFEPSPRESKRLKRHIQVNKCRNVRIESVALGASRGQANLFLVQGSEDYCNSLRPPAVQAQTESISVPITTLDDFLVKANVGTVHFVKLDVEGAELDVLRGAVELLQATPRPVLMVEVYDVRTEPWGYKAQDIVKFLHHVDYEWFELAGDRMLQPIKPDESVYDANLIAVPRESVGFFLASLGIG